MQHHTCRDKFSKLHFSMPTVSSTWGHRTDPASVDRMPTLPPMVKTESFGRYRTTRTNENWRVAYVNLPAGRFIAQCWPMSIASLKTVVSFEAQAGELREAANRSYSFSLWVEARAWISTDAVRQREALQLGQLQNKVKAGCFASRGIKLQMREACELGQH